MRVFEDVGAGFHAGGLSRLERRRSLLAWATSSSRRDVDVLVVQFGPPTSTFKMNSGRISFVWRPKAVTDIVGNEDNAQAQSRFCKVSVIQSPAGSVTQLNT